MVFVPILEPGSNLEAYCPLDLSDTNPELEAIDLSKPEVCQNYIEAVLARNKAQIAYGGYLERRTIYVTPRFSGAQNRNIHLGVDFWASAGTKVLVPYDGVVHSFAHHSDPGNYGPTIILKHQMGSQAFFTLYGHLSLASLENICLADEVKKGAVLGTLGTPDINGGYASHLHFQSILDIAYYQGDYPGVCAEADLDFFKANCPNPLEILGMVNSFR
ncbi:MAG: peptidoglycan DD-metalloendopeptidase family protein [Bacteroidota bacterium]